MCSRMEYLKDMVVEGVELPPSYSFPDAVFDIKHIVVLCVSLLQGIKQRDDRLANNGRVKA